MSFSKACWSRKKKSGESWCLVDLHDVAFTVFWNGISFCGMDRLLFQKGKSRKKGKNYPSSKIYIATCQMLEWQLRFMNQQVGPMGVCVACQEVCACFHAWTDQGERVCRNCSMPHSYQHIQPLLQQLLVLQWTGAAHPMMLTATPWVISYINRHTETSSNDQAIPLSTNPTTATTECFSTAPFVPCLLVSDSLWMNHSFWSNVTNI